MDHISFCDKYNLKKMKNKKQIYVLLSIRSDHEPFDKVFVNDSIYFVDRKGPYNTENRFDVISVIKDESDIANCLDGILLKGESDKLIRLENKYFKRLGKKSKQILLAEKIENASRTLSLKKNTVGKHWLIVGSISNLVD